MKRLWTRFEETLIRAHVSAQTRKEADALADDERGVTILAYGMGAAIVVVPLAVGAWGFASEAVTDAIAIADNAIT